MKKNETSIISDLQRARVELKSAWGEVRSGAGRTAKGNFNIIKGPADKVREIISKIK